MMEEQDFLNQLKKNYLPNLVYIEFPKDLSVIRKNVLNEILKDIWENKDNKQFEFSLKEFQQITGIFLSNDEQVKDLSRTLAEVDFICLGDDGLSMDSLVHNFVFDPNNKIRFEISDLARQYFVQISHWS
jgi:prenyltransferase beta subunit